MRARLVPLTLLALLALTAVYSQTHARDVYGNNTRWTNSDTTIYNIQRERRAQEAVPQWWSNLGTPAPTPSWMQSDAERRAEQRRRDREAYNDYDYSTERAPSPPPPPPKPLTYDEYLEKEVLHRSDRQAQETLAFHYLSFDKPLKAVPHLEMMVFLKKSPRAGEAAYELSRIAAATGAAPDPIRFKKYLTEAVALGYPPALFAQGSAWLFGDEKNGVSPEPAKGEALLHQVIETGKGWDSRAAGRILFQEYYLGTHLPADAAKAIAVTQRMHKITTIKAVDSEHEDRYTELLIASPGGWAEHHEEIIRSIDRNSGSLLYPDKAERLTRIYLGLDEEVAAHVPPNREKAAESLRHLARLAPDRALPYLSVILEAGPQHNPTGAYQILEKLHEDNPTDAKWISLTADLLANLYGDSFEPGLLQGFLASLDSPKASTAQLLGAARYFVSGGQRVRADPERGVRNYERLLSKDRYDYGAHEYTANFELHRLQLIGGVVPQQVPYALQQLEDVIGNETADTYPQRALLASVYRTGLYAPRDLARARSIVAAAARHNHTPSEYEYAATLFEWDNKSELLDDTDRETAFARLKHAADSGLTEARLLLARFYREGFGVAKDPAQALAIYEAGAAADIPGAFAGLAELRLDPASPFHDDAAGFAAAETGTNLGDISAIYLAGECYRLGRGTAVDAAQAVFHFHLASENGHWPSALLGARLLMKGAPGLERDPQRAVALLEMAAKENTSDHQYELGRLFLSGEIVPADDERARYWTKRAADRGHSGAK
jgi:TPR repeat protein